jgi:uncharacterized protein YfiM (DUF2279 family)
MVQMYFCENKCNLATAFGIYPFISKIRKAVFSIFFFSFLIRLNAQEITQNPVNQATNDSMAKPVDQRQHQANKTKVWIVGGSHAVIWAGTLVALNEAWFADYPRTNFHFFNDWNEWQQMDKAGHFWTAYHLSRFSTDSWRWAGVKEKKAVWLGGVSSIAYQSIIEVLDGFSEKWGFSWGDMLMNVTGAGTYVAQELIWKEQRISIKLSYWPYDYPEDVQARADDLFGTSLAEKILKDYNSHTYWLNINLRSFFPDSRIPRWLNFSLGYGGELMLGGTENKWEDENGEEVDRSDIPRFRRFFISADVDLTRIKTKSRFLKTVFSLVNVVKIPAPAIEFSQGKVKGHWIYY